MQIKCDYCGAYFNDTEEQCPTCGAPNNQLRRTASSVPVTIEELQIFIAEKNIPAEKIRFFIGVDYREPKAFGIYRDEMTGNFVVYKNKADGTRAVRYEGKDEAYAVNEIYQKLREEINRNNEQHGRSDLGAGNPSYQNPHTYTGEGNDPERRKNNRKFHILLILFIAIVVISLFMSIAKVSGRTSGHGGFFYHPGYEYNIDDEDSSGGDSDESVSSYDDTWDTDWDSGSSWNSNWDSFDSNWDSDW